MPEHDTDASGQRDLNKEGTSIKMALTSKEDETPPSDSKVNISFTSLAQSSIPNLTAAKILRNRINVKYVPDFYYIIDRCQHLFILAKNDKSIKRIEALNIYSFTLYITYGLMFIYLETVNELDGSDSDVSDVLTFLRGAGYNTMTFPAIASTWIDALGKYIDPETKRAFMPYLPTPVNSGDYYSNYFLSEDTGHLLPNFRAMFSVICLFADPMAINLPPNNRSRNVKLGADFPAIPQLVGTTQSRAYVYRIPGLRRLTTVHKDEELPILLASTLSKTTWQSDLHRYMMLDIEVLRHLKECVPQFFEQVEKHVYSNISPIGTSLVTIPLISDPAQREINEKVSTASVAGSERTADIPAVSIHSGFDFASRVKTRTEVINGNIDYAYQTPVVRIIKDAESVKLGDHIHVSPQDAWYNIEHEFQTPVLTLPNVQAYFQKT